MKNLFSIKKVNGCDTFELDATPYHAMEVSDEVKAKLKGAFSIAEEAAAPRELSEEDKKLKKKSNRYWMGCLACLATTVILYFVGNELGIFAAVPALYAINVALLAGAIYFNVKSKRINRRQNERFNESMKFDFSEATARLTEAAAEAARELGIPEDTLTTDVFPYHYKQNGDKAMPVGKKGKFNNLAVSVFVKDGTLCFATAQELLAVPLTEITGYREYGESFELDMWLKPEDPDSDKYKEFGIRKSGFMTHKGQGYFGLLIGQDNYEVLIPCYDFGEVKSLLQKNGVL